MENMKIYNAVREVPQEAKKTIGAGRLKGFTDINPMWRIKKLTEQFGACGIGWYTELVGTWLEEGVGGTRTAHAHIKLYIKVDGEWSKPIEGIGGAAYITNEKQGAYVSDECYKMAYTDALSVACKALGIGADVYYEKDCTKYSKDEQPEAPAPQPAQPKRKVINDRTLDNREQCDKMLAMLEKAHAQNPDFDVIEFLRAEGFEFEDSADKRVYDIWRQHKDLIQL